MHRNIHWICFVFQGYRGYTIRLAFDGYRHIGAERPNNRFLVKERLTLLDGCCAQSRLGPLPLFRHLLSTI